MSLRLKIIVLLGLMAAAATAAIGITTYRSTSHELRENIDRSLDVAALRFQRGPGTVPDGDGDGRRPGFDQAPIFEQVLWQAIAPDGTVHRLPLAKDQPVSSGYGWIPTLTAHRTRGVWLQAVRGIWHLTADRSGAPIVEEILDDTTGLPGLLPRAILGRSGVGPDVLLMHDPRHRPTCIHVPGLRRVLHQTCRAHRGGKHHGTQTCQAAD